MRVVDLDGSRVVFVGLNYFGCFFGIVVFFFKGIEVRVYLVLYFVEKKVGLEVLFFFFLIVSFEIFCTCFVLF